jgi:hypothetical protein
LLVMQLITWRNLKLASTSGTALGVALAATLVNLLFLEPRSTTVMFQRYKLVSGKGGRGVGRMHLRRLT